MAPDRCPGPFFMFASGVAGAPHVAGAAPVVVDFIDS
jgi:hypothetical protein